MSRDATFMQIIMPPLITAAFIGKVISAAKFKLMGIMGALENVVKISTSTNLVLKISGITKHIRKQANATLTAQNAKLHLNLLVLST